MPFSAGDVGTTLTTVVKLLGVLQFGIRQSVETETNLTSVERLISYTQLEPEKETLNAKNEVNKAKQLDKILNSEPVKTNSSGDINFKNVSFRYHEDGPLVLKNISVKINDGEKVGVVGRTGAGKSSLIAALFRITNLVEGTIHIGKENISEMKLGRLR